MLVGPTRPWAHELPEVILTGQVRDDELAAIYTGARALVLASEHEGFGLPAVEALACGTPVVACEVPALREVLGERATFVAPGDMATLIEAAQAATPPGAGAPRWSWQDAARATWAVYDTRPRRRGADAATRPGRGGDGAPSSGPRGSTDSSLSRRRAARAQRGSSSAGSSGRAPATSARGR